MQKQNISHSLKDPATTVYSTVSRTLGTIHKGFVKVPDENRCLKMYFLCIVQELVSFYNLSLSYLSQRIRSTGTNTPLSQCLPSCKEIRIKNIIVCLGQTKNHSSSLLLVLGEDSVPCIVKNFVPGCCFLCQNPALFSTQNLHSYHGSIQSKLLLDLQAAQSGRNYQVVVTSLIYSFYHSHFLSHPGHPVLVSSMRHES